MNALPTPVDADARTRVRDVHERSLFVEAGAGTGKTTALVDRIVALVASGSMELRRLAAITFTEAAASELRDRIRGELERAANGRTEWVTGDDAQQRCRDALEQLDEAALTTLHGFAQRILAEHPIEAGLPPGFEVLDGIESQVAFDQHWSKFVDDLFDDSELEQTLLIALCVGIDVRHLRGVAEELHRSYDRLHGLVARSAPLPAVDLAPVVAALTAAVSRHPECRDGDDRLARHLEVLAAYRELVAAAAESDDVLDRLEVLIGAPKISAKGMGRKPSWGCDIDEVRDLTIAADAAVKAVLDGQRRAAVEVLTQRTVQFVIGYAAERRHEGTLEFHDLLVLARDVLRADAHVRAAVAHRYERLLLDEFQDTDPLQIELAVLIGTDEPEVGLRAWQDVAVRGGAVSVVGDPKQSIYRFRRADLGVYDDAKVQLGFEHEQLVENFRSVPGVIAFVNHVFRELFAGGEPGVQAPHVDLHAARPPHAGPLTVGIFGEVSPDKVSVVREQEAAEVAALVQRVKGERWKVVVDADGTTRDAKYEDIALLIPSRTVLPGLEAALEAAGVPARIESQSLVFATAEVRDLLAILTAIDDPTDDLAVVAALRSPAFGCSDRDLSDWALGGGRWDHRRQPPDGLAAHRVATALGALRDLWQERWWRSVSEIVESVVRERRMLELAVERRRPRDHWRRIRFFLDQARAYDDRGGRGLRGFVEWVQQQADERARVIESVSPEPDDDAVRILTVHGAKGLEFPVVVLAGLNTSPFRRDPPVIWGEGGPEIAIGNKGLGSWVTTAGYDACLTRELEHEEAERLRLLYVAMTRARDYLLVSLHHKVKTKCHAAKVLGALEGAPYKAVQVDVPDEVPREVDEQAVEVEAVDRDSWIAERAALLATAGRPAAVAATTLAKISVEPAIDDAAPLPPWRRGRAGTAVGRAVHAVLQTIDLATGGGLEATARAQALAEGVPDREAEVRELARSVLSVPIVRAMVDGGWRSWREVPVAALIGDTVVEGFIDLLVESPDGFVIVDYKTDALSDDRLDEALQRYAVQGATYALALERVLGQAVAGCTFVFARERGAVERSVADLPGAVRAVEAEVTDATV